MQPERGGGFGPKELLFLPQCDDPAAEGSYRALVIPEDSFDRVR